MTGAEIIILLALLELKHFIVDWQLQPAWMWKNKGTFGHPGGIAHALLHAVLTFGVLLLCTRRLEFSLIAAGSELVAHYMIDWCKMNLNRKMNLTPATTGFWRLLGTDVYLHSLTYLIIAYAAWWVSFT